MKKEEVEICLEQVVHECKRIKIPISHWINPEVTINYRAKSRFAACKKINDSSPFKYKIEVGEMLLQTDEKLMKTILAHEVIHTCYGCYNHGKSWKTYAQKMNQESGYHIKTTTTYEELGISAPKKNKKVNYEIQCQKCGMIFYRQRKSKLIKNINQYRCKCGGKLKCTQSIE